MTLGCFAEVCVERFITYTFLRLSISPTPLRSLHPVTLAQHVDCVPLIRVDVRDAQRPPARTVLTPLLLTASYFSSNQPLYHSHVEWFCGGQRESECMCVDVVNPAV